MKFAPVNITSGQVLEISQVYRFSIQATFTGTPTGTLNIQVSNDTGAAPTNWANAQSQISVSANGSTIYPFPDMPAKWLKIVYVGSGAGTYTLFTQGV